MPAWVSGLHSLLAASVLTAFLFAPGPVAWAQSEFRDEIERDYSLRSLDPLQVSNLRGGVTVQGWALDKIRVTARRRAEAGSADEARKLLQALDFRYRAQNGGIELAAEYGMGLDIQQRLLERKRPRTSMEMVVYAPARLPLKVWTMSGPVTIKSWSAPLDVRTGDGAITVENVKSPSISLFCPSCAISGKNIQGSLRSMGGTGAISLEGVKGPQIYVESTTGAQELARIDGDILVVSKAGSVSGKNLKGRIEFHTQGGSVTLKEGRGFVSGSTHGGDIDIAMREWRFLDKALLESVRGDIRLSLPSAFSGEVDLWSMFNKTRIEFPLEALSDPSVYGPLPANHLRGRVKDGGEQLRIYSVEGRIDVVRSL